MADPTRRTPYANLRAPKVMEALHGSNSRVKQRLGNPPGIGKVNPKAYSQLVASVGPTPHIIDLKVSAGVDEPQRLPADAAEAVYHEFLAREAERLGLIPNVPTLQRLALRFPLNRVSAVVRSDATGTRSSAVVMPVLKRQRASAANVASVSPNTSGSVKLGLRSDFDFEGASLDSTDASGATRQGRKGSGLRDRRVSSRSEAHESLAEKEANQYRASGFAEPLATSLNWLTEPREETETSRSGHVSPALKGAAPVGQTHSTKTQRIASNLVGLRAGGLLLSTGIAEEIRELVTLAAAVTSGATNATDKDLSSTNTPTTGQSSSFLTPAQARLRLQARLKSYLDRSNVQPSSSFGKSNKSNDQIRSLFSHTGLLAGRTAAADPTQDGEANVHDSGSSTQDDPFAVSVSTRAATASLLSPTWLFDERALRLFAPTPIERARESARNKHLRAGARRHENSRDGPNLIDAGEAIKSDELEDATSEDDHADEADGNHDGTRNISTSSSGREDARAQDRTWTIPLDIRDPSVMRDILAWYRLTGSELAEAIDPRLRLQSFETDEQDLHQDGYARYPGDVIRRTFQSAVERANHDFEPTQYVHIDARDPSNPSLLVPKHSKSLREDVDSQQPSVSSATQNGQKRKDKANNSLSNEILDVWGVPIMAPEIPFACFTRFNQAQIAAKLPPVRIPATASVLHIAREETLKAALRAAEEAAAASLSSAAPIGTAADTVLAASTAAALRVANSVVTLLPNESMYNRFLLEDGTQAASGISWAAIKSLVIPNDMSSSDDQADNSGLRQDADSVRTLGAPGYAGNDTVAPLGSLNVSQLPGDAADTATRNSSTMQGSESTNDSNQTSSEGVSGDVIAQLPGRLLLKSLKPPTVTVNKLVGNAFDPPPIDAPGRRPDRILTDLSSFFDSKDDEEAINLPRLLLELKAPFVPRREYVRHLQRTFIEAIPWGAYEKHYSMGTFLAVRGYIASHDVHELIIICAHIVHAVLFRTGRIRLRQRTKQKVAEALSSTSSTQGVSPLDAFEDHYGTSAKSEATEPHGQSEDASVTPSSEPSAGDGATTHTQTEENEEDAEVSHEAIDVLVQCARAIFAHIESCGRKHKIHSDQLPMSVRQREIESENIRAGFVPEHCVRRLNQRILGDESASTSLRERDKLKMKAKLESKRTYTISYTTVVRPLLLDAIDSCVSNLIFRHFREWHKVPSICESTQALITHIIDAVLNEHGSAIRPEPLRHANLGHTTRSPTITALLNLGLSMNNAGADARLRKVVHDLFPASVYHSDHTALRRLLSGMLTFGLTSLATVSKALRSSLGVDDSRRSGGHHKLSAPAYDLTAAAELDRVLLVALQRLEAKLRSNQSEHSDLSGTAHPFSPVGSANLIMRVIEPSEVPEALFRVLCYVRSRIKKWDAFAKSLMGRDGMGQRDVMEGVTKESAGSALVVRITNKPDFSQVPGVNIDHPNDKGLPGELAHAATSATANLELELDDHMISRCFEKYDGDHLGTVRYTYMHDATLPKFHSKTLPRGQSHERAASINSLTSTSSTPDLDMYTWLERPSLYSPCAGSKTWNRAVQLLIHEGSRHMVLAPILLTAADLALIPVERGEGRTSSSKVVSGSASSPTGFDWKTAFPVLALTSIDVSEHLTHDAFQSDEMYLRRSNTPGASVFELVLPAYAFAAPKLSCSTWTRAVPLGLAPMQERRRDEGHAVASRVEPNSVSSVNNIYPLRNATSSAAKVSVAALRGTSASALGVVSGDDFGEAHSTFCFESQPFAGLLSHLDSHKQEGLGGTTRRKSFAQPSPRDVPSAHNPDQTSNLNPGQAKPPLLSFAVRRGLHVVAEHELAATKPGGARLRVAGPRLLSAAAAAPLARLYPPSSHDVEPTRGNVHAEVNTASPTVLRGPPVPKFYRTQLRTAGNWGLSELADSKGIDGVTSVPTTLSSAQGQDQLGDLVFHGTPDLTSEADWMKGSAGSGSMINLPEPRPLENREFPKRGSPQ